MHDFTSWQRERSYDLGRSRSIQLPPYNLRRALELPPYELCTYLAAGPRPGVTHNGNL
jgi:hypothetical protein